MDEIHRPCLREQLRVQLPRDQEQIAAEIRGMRLRAMGVARDKDHERTLLVHFNRRPTDDEMRAAHEALRALS